MAVLYEPPFLLEVNMFKKTLFALLLIFCFLPLTARAADLNSKAGIVTTTSGRLNIRSAPSTGSTVVGSLANGSYVTLISQSGSWWKVEYANGKFGYCHADYIRTASGNAATVTATSLNVRSGPSTSHTAVGYLHNADTVIVLSTANGWSLILYHGTKLGYVSSSYLSSGYASVALYVPSWKQTDSRWADTTIGTSGKTFAQIGCATTAIAMVESHRTGRTVYPNEMAQNLRYTPSGSVYWPSHYSTVTNTSGYLANIYSLLHRGKPVLFGAKNSYGSQHWVVITGFSGGSLSAANFSIHDPGTVSRSNLQQLLNAYPTVYKYFHY